jgi:hypothetical protein
LEENERKRADASERNNDFPEENRKRTKEEILLQRKEMMKRPDFLRNKTQANDNNQGGEPSGGSVRDPLKKNSKEPNPELLERLALGKKTKVNKKDMLALTSKNYELLPEIKKKKEEEKKREELKKRQDRAKELSEVEPDSWLKIYL